MHIKHNILTLYLSTYIIATSSPAFACKTLTICDIERIEGQVPCVELTIEDGSCYVAAAWTCKPNDPPVTITRLHNMYSVTLGGGGSTAEGVGAGSYTWQRGEQSGTLEIIGTSRTSGDCSQQDETCAAAPASRPAHTPQLLILTLGLIAGWRRYNHKLYRQE